MKFPLHTDADPGCSRVVHDDDGTFVALATNPEVAQMVMDALTLQHDMADMVPVHMTKAVPDLGSIPAADITYRQELIEAALEGFCANREDHDDNRAIACHVLGTVDRLLKRMAKEEG